jgi:hypothetical protein
LREEALVAGGKNLSDVDQTLARRHADLDDITAELT